MSGLMSGYKNYPFDILGEVWLRFERKEPHQDVRYSKMKF